VKDPAERRRAIEARHPVWASLTIAGLQDRAAADFPERPLVVTADRVLSYADVQAESRRIASGLIAAGLHPGEHVALIMANFPEFVPVKLAIARAGGVCVPVNFLLRSQELAYVLDQSDSRFLIAMDAFRGHDYLADIASIRSGLPELHSLFALPTGEACSRAAPSLRDLADMANPQSGAELARREAVADGQAISDIIYTSGTTGRPKGVLLTHDMVLRAAYSSALTRSFEDGRRIQYAMPMYHVFGYVECFIASLFVGGAIVPHPVFEPEQMLDWAERLETTDLVCVPLMTRRLIELARERGFHAPSLLAVFNSGGVNPPEIWAEIREVLGAKEIHTGYGMSETTASTVCTHTEDGDARLIESNGREKLAGVAGDPELGGRVAIYRVADPQTGAPLPCNTDGELQARGPIVTAGYYHKPEETLAAFTPDGWLRTGDVGRLSEDGYLTLTGRIKESFRCGGEMVMPREIELLFEGYPGIAQALVVGVPDGKMGEVGCLCVVAGEGGRPDDRELIDHCVRRLARFKVPRHVLWLEAGDIPLTVTGRPQKFRLAKLAIHKIEEREDNVH